jgi:hypothetical protein
MNFKMGRLSQMVALGIPEILVLLVMLAIYVIIVPAVLSVGLRIFMWVAEGWGVPEAIGRFAAKSAKAFRAQRAQNE